MNTTDNKTSLYDSVTKNDKIEDDNKITFSKLKTLSCEDDDETEEELDDDETIDESPTEEKPSTNGDKKCIIDKAIENKIAHNIKVAKDILDNTLPYYVINDNIEPLAIKTDKSLKRDLNNFNYFTNKEDVDEAIRRVKETLMNFQEEIQNRNK